MKQSLNKNIETNWVPDLHVFFIAFTLLWSFILTFSDIKIECTNILKKHMGYIEKRDYIDMFNDWMFKNGMVNLSTIVILVVLIKGPIYLKWGDYYKD